MATLDLPDCSATLVWRLIRNQIKGDPVLIASGATLVFFDDSGSAKEITSYPGLVVLFYATLGRMGWFDESSQYGALIVNYETLIPSLDDEDAMNLQSAIQNALYPADSFVFGNSLVAAGAITGQPLFQQPLTAPMSVAGNDNMMRASGLFTLEIDSPLIPT